MKKACYWFGVFDGVIKGGAGGDVPAEALALPGFHIAAPWAEIAHASGFLYGPKGQAERSKQAAVLTKALKEAGVGGSGYSQGFLDVVRSKPKQSGFPRDIGMALGDNDERPGLHNAAALLMGRSPEMEGFPESP